MVDEFKVYTRALTETEIAQDYDTITGWQGLNVIQNPSFELVIIGHGTRGRRAKMVKKLRQNGDFFGVDFGTIEEVRHPCDACSNNKR